MPLHSPSVDLVLLVLEGEGEVTGGANTRSVQPGDIVVVPAHVKRGVKAKTRMTILHAVFPLRRKGTTGR
ncbi:MAG: cupin domain-containing protein [Deltaproteobacteria bacterium]|nr:MAG: cupin domain-containing protein [Deltaproteobacteria bacterium]